MAKTEKGHEIRVYVNWFLYLLFSTKNLWSA